MLLGLTRLGAKEAILLSDRAFAGADTLATAYTLSLAIKALEPDLVICGRQTLVGDTAQTGGMLSVKLGYSLITNVMKIESVGDGVISCKTRESEKETAALPAVITVERISTLRLPRLRSKIGECRVLSSADIGADPALTGLSGSPTRVISTAENDFGRRKCKFIKFEELDSVIKESLAKRNEVLTEEKKSDKKLGKVLSVGEAPLEFAKTVSDNVHVLEITDADTLAEEIKSEMPDAVIWGSDFLSKRLSSVVAARLDLGLCADCTSLETDGKELYMIRPALSGSVIAKIKSLTKPAMATVRTAERHTPCVIIGAGYGA
jgi:electron transfer flavoprotein alpha/beta subunit